MLPTHDIQTNYTVYCINLDTRTDRWQSFSNQSLSFGLEPAMVTRWSAVEDKIFGHLGCLKSHVSALTNFIITSELSYCVVLEDDFEFLQNFDLVIKTINDTNRFNLPWDVLLLQGYYTKAYPKNELGLSRVFESCATGGYIVKRQYVGKLVAYFLSSIVPLEQFRGHPQRNLVAAPLFADQVWKQLQMRDNWYIFNPPIGRQAMSFSDLEGRVPEHIENFRFKGD
jgi:hypothetical protein